MNTKPQPRWLTEPRFPIAVQAAILIGAVLIVAGIYCGLRLLEGLGVSL